MMTVVKETLRRFWVKSKWYVLAVCAALLLAALWFLRTRKPKLVQIAMKTVFEGQKRIVEKELANVVATKTKTQKELVEVETRLKELDERLEDRENEIDAMDMLELVAAWKALGM